VGFIDVSKVDLEGMDRNACLRGEAESAGRGVEAVVPVG
jgi:hypothetical protein